jgi:hypothetical protein
MKTFPPSLRFYLLAFLFLAAPALRAQSAQERAQSDVEYLASPELKGRGYLFDGHARAAAYIRERFAAIGLDSFPGGYYQRFAMAVNEFPGAPALAINGTELEPGRAFLPDESCGSGTIPQGSAPVMAGNGLILRSRGIDDFNGRPVQGSVIVIDEKLPDAITSDKGIDRRLLALDTRIGSAVMLGARAVLVLTDRLTYGKYGVPIGVPVFNVLRSAMPDSVGSIACSVENAYEEITTQNVVGYIRGSGHPERFLLLTAHYDHIGAFGSIYFPGANDNASGVAMLLSLARHFRENPPAYSVAFVAFSGEEAGLFGSQYFAEHPPLPLSQVRFLLNMDMVASGKEGITAVGGEVFSEEFELLKEAAEDAGVKDVRKRENAPNSDHYPIVSRGVRGFYVYPFTGYQPYHHIDDRPETLEWDVFTRLRTIFIGFLESIQRD